MEAVENNMAYTGKHAGVPLSEKDYKAWQKSFSDIEQCIKELEEQEKKHGRRKTRS